MSDSSHTNTPCFHDIRIKKSKSASRKRLILMACILSFLTVWWPFLNKLNAAESTRVILIYKDKTKEKKEVRIIEGIDRKEIKVRTADTATDDIVNCYELSEIIKLQDTKILGIFGKITKRGITDKMTKRGITGAAAGAAVGAIVAGVGTVPLAIIGFFVGTFSTPVLEEDKENIKSEYCD